MADFSETITLEDLKNTSSMPMLDSSVNFSETITPEELGLPTTEAGVMPQFATSQDYADSTGNKWDIATDQLAAQAYDGLGLIADIFGADETAAEYRADADRYQKMAASRPKPSVSMSVTEEVPKIVDQFSEGEILEGISNSAELAHSLMVGVLPSLGASAGGAAVGILAAPVLGTVGVPAALTAAVGMMAPGYLLSSGSIYDEAKEQGASEGAAKTAAVGGGVVVGALDRLGMSLWLKGITDKLGKKAAIDTVSNITGISKKTTEEALKTAAENTTKGSIKKTFSEFGKGASVATASKEVVKGIVKSPLVQGTKKGAVAEGLTEAGQEVVQIASAAVAGDKTADAVSAESGKRIIDALAMGIASGPFVGVAQAATAPIRKEAHRKAVEMEQLNDRLAKATTDYEKELILGERTALTEGRRTRTGLEEEQPGVDFGPKFAELGKLEKEFNDINKVEGKNPVHTKRKRAKLKREFNESEKGKRRTKLKKELRFKKEGYGGMLKKLVSRSTSALESFANRTPVAREIINSLNNIVNNTNQRVGQFSTIKTQILDGIRRDKKLPFQKSIDSEVNQKLFDILFRGDVAVTDDPAILQAAQRIRESLLNPIHKMLVDAGSNMGYEENYLPAVIKNFGLGPGRKKRRQEFIDILNEYRDKDNPNGIDGEAYLERAMENEGLYHPDDSFAELAIDQKTESEATTLGLELPRQLPRELYEQLADKGFLETDVEKLLNRYIVTTGRNLEAKDFVNKYNPAIQEFLDNGLLQDSEARYLKKIVDGVQNRYNNIKDKRWKNLYKFVLTGTYILTLGLSAIPSLVEPILVLSRVSPKNALWGAFKALKVSGRKGIRAFRPKFDRSKDELALGSLMQTADMALNDAIRDIGDTTISKTVTDKFFRLNLLAQVTQFSRNIAFQAGRLQIRDDIKTLERERETGDVTGESTNARKRLLELGLINTVARSKDVTPVQEEISNWANSVELDPEQVQAEPEIITKALGKLVNEIIMTPDAVNKPLWMSDPRLAPVAQLKGFATVFGNTIGMKLYKDVFLPMQKGRVPAGDIAKNAMVFTLLMTAIMGTQALKDAIRYGDDESPFDKLEGYEKFWYALRQSQLFGYGGIIYDALDSEKYGSSPIEYLLGPWSSIASRTATDLASGDPKRVAKGLANLLPDLPYAPARTIAKNIIDD
jgi:hypothetical protein